MQAVRCHTIADKDGEITVHDIPCKTGQELEVIVLLEPEGNPNTPIRTSGDLAHSGLFGIWRNRTDISNSTTFARQLREKAQRRTR